MTYDDYFEWQLIYNLGNSEELMALAASRLEPSDFSSAGAAVTYAALKGYVSEYGKLPSAGVVPVVIRAAAARGVEGVVVDENTASAVESFVEALSGPPHAAYIDIEYYSVELPKFALDRRFSKLSRESLDGPKTPEDLLAQARKYSDLASAGVVNNRVKFQSGLGSELFSTREVVERIPTNIGPLDKALHGGMDPESGQSGLIFAGQGVGKTVTLVNLANAATVFGEEVLFITLEQPAQAIIHINAAIEAHIRGSVFKKNGVGFTEAELDRLAIVTDPEYPRRDMLSIVDWSEANDTTVADVAEAVKQWREAAPNNKRRLVVVDWLNYMEQKARARSRNRTDEELTALSVGITKLAKKEKFALWSATQGTKETVDKSYLTRKDIAGAYHINDPFEIVVGVVNKAVSAEDRDFKSGKEPDEDEATDLTHTVVKNRHGPKEFSYSVHRGKTLRLWKDADAARHAEKQANAGDYQHLFGL